MICQCHWHFFNLNEQLNTKCMLERKLTICSVFAFWRFLLKRIELLYIKTKVPFVWAAMYLFCRKKKVIPVTVQYWSLLNWHNLRFRCGCVAVPVNLFFDIISLWYFKFKNVIHSLEPCETPSYSASHQAPNYVHCSNISQKYLKTLRCGRGAVAFIISIYLKPVL